MLHTLIPKNKFDMDAVELLKQIDPEITDISSIIAPLFEWIQDINWPVARELYKVLAHLKPVDIVPQIISILNTDDEDWKFTCIYYLIPELPRSVQLMIKSDLYRMVTHPTESERLDGINEGAQELYDLLFPNE